MLVYLMIDLELNPGVINVLIDYVLSTQENKLPKKYVEAIATAWKREKIETVEQARARAKRDYQTRNNTVKKQTTVIKKTNEVADWFGKEQTVKTDANKEAELKELMNQI